MGVVYQQAAAIPFRFEAQQLQILLVQTRSGNRWTIPKGLIDPGFTPQETALQEAYEEAGIKGVLHPDVFGEFSYAKWQGVCKVQIFLMKVESELSHWPEKYFRQRKWEDIDQAVKMIKYSGLGEVIRKLERESDSLDILTKSRAASKSKR
ncbi:MAG: NUDIX domain-containing protein [Calditrichae bacterium]|nr:NUDIX domain-containing protein [Calditrichia bacterium]